MPARTLIVTTTAAAALVSALAGCSSEVVVAAPSAKVDLSNTSWSGPCAGTGLGAYTFDFGAGNTDGGTVRISFPDAKTVKTAQYTLQSDGSGHTSFTIAMDPPWKGGLQRDYKTLEMSYTVGDQPGGYHCSLVRLGPNGTS